MPSSVSEEVPSIPPKAKANEPKLLASPLTLPSNGNLVCRQARPSRTSHERPRQRCSSRRQPSQELAIFMTRTPHDGPVLDVVGNSDVSCHHLRVIFQARFAIDLALGIEGDM